jgi:hypothetical protein
MQLFGIRVQALLDPPHRDGVRPAWTSHLALNVEEGSGPLRRRCLAFFFATALGLDAAFRFAAQ